MMINDQGVVIKLQGEDISKVGRNTQGVRLMRLKGDERIATICKVHKEDPDDEDEPDGDDTSDSGQMNMLDEDE